MRSSTLIGVVGVLGLFLAGAACSSETSDSATPTDDAGSSGSSGKKGSSSSGSSSGDDDTTDEDGGTTTKKDGSTSPPGLPSDTLAQGDVQLLGIAGDDAIYIAFGTASTMNAVPLAGGQPTKIADIGDNDQFQLSGGAVAIWTDITADGVGTLSVWSRATGLKASVASNSAAGGLFEASSDGSRIAFSQDVTVSNAKLTSAPIGVRDTSAATNAVTLTGSTSSGNAFDLASQNCAPSMGFAGKVFFAVFCTGTATTTSTARLVTVAATGTTVDRLDATGAASSTLRPDAGFVADSTGAKVFVIKKTNDEGRLITVGGAAGGVSIEQNIAEGVLLPDGNTILYRSTGNVLKKSTTTASPTLTTLVAADAVGFLGITPDFKNVFFNKLAPDQGSPLADLNVVDQTAATPAAVPLVATKDAAFIGANGASTHAIFIGDITQTGATLKSIPIGGGTVKSLGPTVGARLAKSGTSAVSLSNPQEVGTAPNTINIFDIAAVDTVNGTTKTIADSNPEGELFIKDKRVVYSRLAQTGAGVYAATLP